MRNTANSRFYRYERPEEDRQRRRRVRIRPLELFPNGLLLEKPMDTIVDPDLDVERLAKWRDELFIVAQPGWGKQRRFYERELADLEIKLASLQEQAAIVHAKQRGSHANKVRSVQLRVEALQRGLERRLLPPELMESAVIDEVFKQREVVQLPSGEAAVFCGYLQTANGTLAQIQCQSGSFALSVDVLRPIDHRWLSTV